MTDHQSATVVTAATGADAPTVPSRFRPDIQGLRAVAVTAVVLFHAGAGFSGGFVGVDVFFVISGYVITGMLRAEHHRRGRISLRRFYLRRIRRLLPALAVLLVAVVALAPLLGPLGGGLLTTRMATAGALFSANVRLITTSQGYFDARAEANPLLHLWTLSVEEQVYPAVPLLFLVAWKLGRGRWSWERTTAVAAGVAGLGSLALAVALAGHVVPGLGDPTADRLAFYSSPTRAWEFLVGSLLALGLPPLTGRMRVLAGAVGAAVLLVCFVTFDEATAFPGIAAGVPVAATALLLVAGAGTGGRDPVGRALSSGPARWLGDRSYSWYLWHWPLIVFAGSLFPEAGWARPSAALISLVPAAVSYALVEDPIRGRSSGRARSTVLLGVACVVAPLVATVGQPTIERRLDRVASVQDLQTAMRAHADIGPRRCNDSLPDPDPAEVCTWPVAGATGRALLIGDSNAGQFSEPFVAAANASALDATIQTRAACPFADLVVRRNGVVDQRCRTFYERQLAAIVASPPDVVVIGQAGDLLVDKDEVELAGGPDGPFEADDGGQLKVWEQAVDRTLDALDRAGVGVVLVHPVPRFTGWPSPGECARLRIMVDVDGCGTERVRPEPVPIAAAEAGALRRHPGVVGLDLGPTLCPEGRCRTVVAGTWRWRDESHLSVDGALSIEPELAAAIEAALGAAGGRSGP